MTIRKALPFDAEAIANLIMEVAPACQQDFGPDGYSNFLAPNTSDLVLKRIHNRDYLSLLCDRDGMLVGIISIKNDRVIDQLFVHPAYWRKGIARTLWQAALERLRQNPEARLITVKSSTMGLQAYQSFGFEVTGEKSVASDIAYYPMALQLDAVN